MRTITAGIALGLVLLAFIDEPILQGGLGFGWVQGGLLAAGVCLGVLCFAPLSLNQKFLILVISVGLSLVLAEAVLRPVLGPRYLPILQRDDRLLYRLIPGVERVRVLDPINGGTVIRYKINSQGFRGVELARPGASMRVVVYGDSFIQGDFARTEDTFTEQLKGRLASKTSTSVEVVNAGVGGYGPDQELRRMEDELPVLKPNLVIVAIYAGNDFGDLLRDKLYWLSNDGSLQDNPLEFLDAATASAMSRSSSEPILRKILRSARLRLGNLLMSHSDRDRRKSFDCEGDRYAFTGHEARRARVDCDLKQGIDEYREYVIEGNNAVHDLFSDPYNADVSLTPTSEAARYKIEMMEQIMRRMGETAAKNNAALVFLLIPSPIDAVDEHEAGEVDLVKYPEYKRSTLTDILEKICRRNGFRAVNLFGPFWQRRADDLYLKGLEDHWNPRGEAYASELVSEFVSSQHLLDGLRPDSETDQSVSGQLERENGH